MRSDVQARVLGPVELETATGPVDLGGPALRALSAALILDAGRVVPADTLVDRLWDGARGDSAAATLHTYVSRLRRQLEPTRPDGGWQVLETRAPGYRLVLPPDGSDAERFARLVREARSHPDPRAARSAVGEALGLWRGPAYVDVPRRFVVDETARLEEQRLEARELAAELDLALGGHRQLVEELPALVRAHPLREGLRRLLMLALYRSARQADALQVYVQTRELLADTLGVDPGPELRQLYELVLRQDPVLDAPEPAGETISLAAAAAGPVEPVQPVAPPSAARATALPQPPTPLLGRDRDVRAVTELLARGARVVTLTGTGGVGKTRLSLAVAENSAPLFPDGVVLVQLAPLQDPEAVLATIARSLGVTVPDGPGVGDAVAAHLSPLRLLLVLDNVEHLLDAAADIGVLVTASPRLAVLATSRAPLRISAEQEHLVQPLELPDPLTVDPITLAESPAVALFVARAQAVAPQFRLDRGNAQAIKTVCSRLAGIPLAIELAAARVRAVDPAALLARLDDALSAGPRDLPPRQRTMRATLDWSYGLLEPEPQRLFRRLAVFTGGWTLPLLEAVEGTGVVGPLEALVEHSLVVVGRDSDEPRYTMLEPIMQHARRLITPEERSAAGRAHAAAYLDLAERAAHGYQGADQLTWLREMDLEHANVLAAVESALAEGDPATAGRLVWAMWLFWWMRGEYTTGRRMTGAAVAAVSDAGGIPPPVRSRTYIAHAAMAFALGLYPQAVGAWTTGLEIARAAGDVEAEAHSLAGLGIVALSTGDPRRAQGYQRGAIELARQLEPSTDGPWILSLNLVWLGTALLQTGERRAAREQLELGLQLARSRGDRLATFVALFNLSQVELGQDDEAAHRHLIEGIVVSGQVSDLANLAYFLEALAVVEVRTRGGAGDPVRLATLLGAAEALRDAVGADVYSYYLPEPGLRDRAAAEVCQALGSGRYEAARASGRSLTVADAVRLAVEP